MHTACRALVVAILVAFLSNASEPARAQSPCDTLQSETFTVHLPVLGYPPDEEGQGWDRPKVWAGFEDARDDSIVVPNGRPIYALIVSGYASNKHLDELMVYDFARHLLSKGAYVHYAWWNNLLAPYMERPLHHAQSEPGDLNAHATDFVNMTAEEAGRKAVPSEDYQLVADARRFLAAIRRHNPGAIVVVVGHSMGGGAVVHIGSTTGELIDILAPIDPVGNRNYPFAGNERVLTRDFNWTRWRVSRDTFLGYRRSEWDPDQGRCVPTGPWLEFSPNIGSLDPRCAAIGFAHDAPTLVFGSNIVNLHHRYQQEYLFPFDYGQSYPFGHAVPTNGISTQAAVPMTPEFCGFLDRCADPGGWPALGLKRNACCATGDGVGWPNDGHGEIVGYRGPLPDPIPLGVRVRTSPECGNGCDNLTWPERYKDNDDVWVNGNGALRKQLLTALETLPAGTEWAHRPTNPALCLVSGGLVSLFNTMNLPPVADAGDDQVVECTGQDGAQVTLDGSGSSDPDGDPLTYTWTWPNGSATGVVATATFALGSTCVTLTVRDPSGHYDRDEVTVSVVDTTPPELTVEIFPSSIWPPNHKMVDVEAEVHAEDLCGEVISLTLVSVVSSEPDNGLGDGNTVGDIAGAETDTLDIAFQLRAERQGRNRGRVYTVTYQATDDSGNRGEVATEIVVENLPPGRPRGFRVTYDAGGGNRLDWLRTAEPDFLEFAIYRSKDPSFAPDPGHLVARTTATSWVDPQAGGRDVTYRITTVDQTGLESRPATADPGTGVAPATEPVATARGESAEQPRAHQNSPNPFNPSTVIRFTMPASGFVTLTVHDVLGRQVALLRKGELAAGDHMVVWNAGDLPSGVYYYRIERKGAPGAKPSPAQTRKMVLVK